MNSSSPRRNRLQLSLPGTAQYRPTVCWGRGKYEKQLHHQRSPYPPPTSPKSHKNLQGCFPSGERNKEVKQRLCGFCGFTQAVWARADPCLNQKCECFCVRVCKSVCDCVKVCQSVCECHFDSCSLSFVSSKAKENWRKRVDIFPNILPTANSSPTLEPKDKRRG